MKGDGSFRSFLIKKKKKTKREKKNSFKETLSFRVGQRSETKLLWVWLPVRVFLFFFFYSKVILTNP